MKKIWFVGLFLSCAVLSACTNRGRAIEDAFAYALAEAQAVGGTAGLLEWGDYAFSLAVSDAASPIYGAKILIPGGTIKVAYETGPVIVTILPAAQTDQIPHDTLLELYGPPVEFKLSYIAGNKAGKLNVKTQKDMKFSLPFNADPASHPASYLGDLALLGPASRYVAVQIKLDELLLSTFEAEPIQEAVEPPQLRYGQIYGEEEPPEPDQRTITSGWSAAVGVYAAAVYNVRVCNANKHTLSKSGVEEEEYTELQESSYNDDGQLVKESFYAAANNEAPQLEKQRDYSYDALGYRTAMLEKDAAGKVVNKRETKYDTEGRALSTSGQIVIGDTDYSFEWQWVVVGQKRVKTLYEYRVDGTIVRSDKIKLNEAGLVVFEEHSDSAGRYEVVRNTYINDLLSRTEIDQRYLVFNTSTSEFTLLQVDDKVDVVTKYRYNRAGFLIRSESDTTQDGEVDSYIKYEYDANNRLVDELAYLVKQTKETDADDAEADDILTSSRTYGYHSSNYRSAEYVVHNNSDGQPTSLAEYRWDASGRPTYESRDDDADGVLDI